MANYLGKVVQVLVDPGKKLLINLYKYKVVLGTVYGPPYWGVSSHFG